MLTNKELIKLGFKFSSWHKKEKILKLENKKALIIRGRYLFFVTDYMNLWEYTESPDLYFLQLWNYFHINLITLKKKGLQNIIENKIWFSC